jgi:hypothetical protein
MRTEMMIGREGIESKVRRKFQGAMREEPRKAFRQALT